MPDLDAEIFNLATDILALWDENNALGKVIIGGVELNEKAKIPLALSHSIADRILETIQFENLTEVEKPKTEPDETDDNADNVDSDRENTVEDEKSESDADDELKTKKEGAKAKIKAAFDDDDKNAFEIGEAVQAEVVDPVIKDLKEAETDEERQTLVELIKEIIKEIREVRQEAAKNRDRFPSKYDEESLRNAELKAVIKALAAAADIGSDDKNAVRAAGVLEHDPTLRENVNIGQAMNYEGVDTATKQAFAALDAVTKPDSIRIEKKDKVDIRAIEQGVGKIKTLTESAPTSESLEDEKLSWLQQLITDFKTMREHRAKMNKWAKTNAESQAEIAALEAAKEMAKDLGLNPDEISRSLGFILDGEDEKADSARQFLNGVLERKTKSASLKVESGRDRKDPRPNPEKGADRKTKTKDKPEDTDSHGLGPETVEAEALSVDFTTGLIGLRRKFHINRESEAYRLLTQPYDMLLPDEQKEHVQLWRKIENSGVADSKIKQLKAAIEKIGAAKPKLVMAVVKSLKKHDLKLKPEQQDQRLVPLGLVTEVE